MIKIDNEQRIEISRGDAATLEVTANKGQYEFQVDDVIRLRIFEKGNYDVILKEISTTVAEATTKVNLQITKNDTIIGDNINKPKTYWYEISLNETKTIIGYDENGAKEFVILPAEKGD